MYRMPAEYQPHRGTMMIWPVRPGSWGRDPSAAQAAFLRVFEAVTQSEELYLLAGPDHLEEAKAAVAHLDRVRLCCIDSDDAWARDVGPTFVRDEAGRLKGISWAFNAWGGAVDGLYADWAKDDAVAPAFCAALGLPCEDAAPFVLEGGSIHTDGEGTALVTASCLLSPGRNPGLSRAEIEAELWDQVKYFEEHDKLLEAQRIRQRTLYDIEMMQELGYCSGIENYSRIISGRPVGSAPMTLLDYFPKDFLLFVDESHVTLPQVRAMYNGDRARKESLVGYGFRLPCAFDNRPLTFPEFEERINQAIYVSATPGEYELSRSAQTAEQVIRPTGLLDPEVEVRPVTGQIDDLMGEIRVRAERNERVLVTTLTKKMAEDLTEYLRKHDIRVRYMHSDISAMERMEIIRDLRLAKFDVLVGINLLREGLDLPEVSLVAVLDADKEGFLRSETSLIQTMGRAARNAEGKVILYADGVTPSMRAAMDETARRRSIQDAYNQAHGIVPKTIVKSVRDLIEISKPTEEVRGKSGVKMTKAEKEREIARLEKAMREAARMMEFEYAAVLRDQIIELRK